MKLRIHFKTPGAVDYAVKDAFAGIEADPNTGEKLIDGMTEDDVRQRLEHWIEYGEGATIEVMITEEGHWAAVIPAKK